MPKKLGNAGHGLESYDSETGQYVSSSPSGESLSKKTLDEKPKWAKTKKESASSDDVVSVKKVPIWAIKKKAKVEINHSDFNKVDAINEDVSKQFELFQDKNDFYDFLLQNEAFDKSTLDDLFESELKELSIAQKNVDLLPQINLEMVHKLEDINKDGKLIWITVPTTLDALKISLEKKQQYFKDEIDKSKLLDLTNEVNLFDEQLAKIDKIQNEIIPAWENINQIIDNSRRLVEKYSNPDAVYSIQAKNNAKWFKTFNQSSKHFTDIQNTYALIDSEDLNVVKFYTSSYKSINQPLRSIMYDVSEGWSDAASKFVGRVQSITRAIDKAKLKENMWVQRGVSQLNINGMSLGYNATNDSLLGLVGVTFQDQGFVSCSAHKGGGFSGNIIMNIYLPKNSHALYVNPISHYSGGSEDEIIIQRGYSYKISKAYKSGGQIYIDCDLQLGTDSKKYSDEELKTLLKYFK